MTSWSSVRPSSFHNVTSSCRSTKSDRIGFGGDSIARHHQSTFFVDHADAVAWRNDLLGGAGRGLRAKGGKITVGEWLHTWLTSSLMHREPGTIHGHEWRVKNHIAPALGHVRLTDLEPLRIARMLGSLPEEGSRRLMVRQPLAAALAEAEDLELIVRNPARKRNLRPPYTPVFGEAKYWTERKVAAFLNYLRVAPTIKVHEVAPSPSRRCTRRRSSACSRDASR